MPSASSQTKKQPEPKPTPGSDADQPPEKLSGGLPDEPEGLQSEEQALDEALAETFPASDPISPSGPSEKKSGRKRSD